MKVFRRLRYYFLGNQQVRQYLVYAIGEIFLVVIGILIALQINTWNENRKLRTDEMEMLRNLFSSVKGDLEDINTYIEIFDQADESIYTLIVHMETNLPYNDSLRFHYTMSTVMWPPRFNKEVFESLSSSDLNNITNDSLKTSIIKYYYDANNTIAGMERYANVVEDASKRIFNTRFNALWSNSWPDPHFADFEARTMKPIDYESLKKDQEYRYFLSSQKNQLYWYVRSRLQEAKGNAENLIELFQEELEME